MAPIPLADVARVLSGIDFAAEPSRSVLVAVDHGGETARVLQDRLDVARFLGRLQGEWQGRPVALPDIPEWGEPRGIPKLARELEESISPLMGCSPRPVCKGSTKCKVCRTFRCARCKKRRPWCIGGNDSHPTWCDQCWRRRHRFAARRCWKCDPAGSDTWGGT